MINRSTVSPNCCNVRLGGLSRACKHHRLTRITECGLCHFIRATGYSHLDSLTVISKFQEITRKTELVNGMDCQRSSEDRQRLGHPVPVFRLYLMVERCQRGMSDMVCTCIRIRHWLASDHGL